MELKPDFAFTPIPEIKRPLRFSLAGPTDSPLGFLEGLKGTWIGKAFNVIWRPFQAGPPNQDRFLELSLTEETLSFVEIPGAIPNRGLLEPDINMFGLRYLQQIADANVKDANAALVTATFWIETVAGPSADGPDFHQLQYTQRVLLNFNGLSWPHITVATLQRSVPYTVKQGDTLSAIARQFYGNGREPLWRMIYNANVAVIGPDPDAFTSGQQIQIPT